MAGISSLTPDLTTHLLKFLDARSLARANMVCKGWRENAVLFNDHPQFVTALSDESDFKTALGVAIKKCMEVCFKPNVGFLFFADSYIRDESEDKVKAAIAEGLKGLPDIRFIGSTGSGIVGQDAVTGECREIETSMSDGSPPKCVSLALAAIPGAYADSYFIKEDKDFEAMAKAMKAYGGEGQSKDRSVRVVLLVDPSRHSDMETLEYDRLQFLNREFPRIEVTGGLASSTFRHKSRVLCKSKDGELQFSNGAMAALTLITSDEAMSAKGAMPITYASVARVSGPVGPAFKVVEIEEDDEGIITKLQQVDDQGQAVGEPRPATQALIHVAQTLKHPQMQIGISAEANPNPSQLALCAIHEIRGEGMCVEPDDGVSKVEVGNTLRFMAHHDGQELNNEVHSQLRWTQQWLGSHPGFGNRLVDSEGRAETKSVVRGGLLFSCTGRGARMYGKPNVDSEAFAAAFPTSRGICGFFCNGEIGPTHLGSCKTQTHGFTSVYTLFEGV